MKPLSTCLKAVAFDAVGTLIEPVPGVAQAYRDAALKVGLDLPAELIHQRFRTVFGADESGIDHKTNEENELKRWRGIVGICLPELTESLANRVFEDLWRHFAEPASWRLFPDVLPCLDFCRGKGLSVCVASNFDSRLRNVWEGLPGVKGQNIDLIISSEVGTRKPGKAFYGEVIRHFGCGPESILFVGDDLVNDSQVPSELGFKTVFLDRRVRMNIHESIAHLGELPRLRWLNG